MGCRKTNNFLEPIGGWQIIKLKLFSRNLFTCIIKSFRLYYVRKVIAFQLHIEYIYSPVNLKIKKNNNRKTLKWSRTEKEVQRNNAMLFTKNKERNHHTTVFNEGKEPPRFVYDEYKRSTTFQLQMQEIWFQKNSCNFIRKIWISSFVQGKWAYMRQEVSKTMRTGK